MATSVQNDVIEAVENEISCPICLDEFDEPKCLPSCAHNVCQLCLEGMVKKRKDRIECPVCRVESVIPQEGVAAFPKNHLLVRLIERTPGRKEKQSIKEAIKSCSTKLESAKAAFKEMEDRFEKARSEVDETRKKIASSAERIISMVRLQEQKMMDEIERKFRENRNEGTFEEHKSTAFELCENASGCIQTVEDILQNTELADLKDLREAIVEELDDFTKTLETRTFWANCEFKDPFDVSFTSTDSVKKFIEDECSLGKLVINTESDTSQSGFEQWPSAPPDADFSRCGSVLLTVDSSSTRIRNFNPFSVAAWRNSAHFAALDEEKKRVHIFDEGGEITYTFRIMYGDLWDIAVSNDYEVVVVNRESNRLLHYDVNGNFLRKFMTAPNDNVKFTSLSVDIHGRLITTSNPHYGEDVKPCILVYSSCGRLLLSFGENVLQSPEKAVFLNGKFFVPDSERGHVLVFNKSGDHVAEIGYFDLESPSSIAADHVNGNVAVSDSRNSMIYIYSQDGDLLHSFCSEFPPKQIALANNCKSLLICSDTGDGRNKIQMVTYTF